MSITPKTLRMSHPCAFSWDELQAGSTTRYCNACDKEIVDFSKFTDAELMDFFKNQSSRICGLFHDKQLNRELHHGNWDRMVFQSKRIAAAVLLAIGISHGTHAQAPVATNPVQATSHRVHIKGLILLEDIRKPAVYAKISLFDKDKFLYSFFTDAEGGYYETMDSTLLSTTIHVVIESDDNRVRYEEDVPKSELLSFFNRAIPFYDNRLAVVESETDSDIQISESAGSNIKEPKKKWNPFRKKKRYYRFRPLGCPEF